MLRRAFRQLRKHAHSVLNLNIRRTLIGREQPRTRVLSFINRLTLPYTHPATLPPVPLAEIKIHPYSYFMVQASPELTATRVTPPSQPALQRWVAPPQARLFLGVSIPPATQAVFEETLAAFPQYVEKMIPPAHWHLTLAFLGEVENPQQYLSRLLKPLPQTYVPTVSVMHVGRGLHRMQLWAYAHPSTSLLNVREQLLDRLRTMRFPLPKDINDFVPHVHLATLYPMARGIGIADYPCATRFVINEINLYESLQLGESRQVYKVRASIPLN